MVGANADEGSALGRFLTSSVVMLVCGLAAGAVAALISAHREAGLGVLCFLVAPLPIFVRVAQRRFDPFEPIQIVAIAFIILYGLRPGAELIWNIKSFSNQYARDGFDGAALISAVGMLSVYLGYALTAGRRIAVRTPSVPSKWDPQRSVRFGTQLLIVCVLLTGLFAVTVGPSTLFHFYLGRSQTTSQTFLAVSGYVALGPYLTIPASIIFLFAYARLRTFKTLVLFLVSLAGAVFISFPQGDRTYVLALVMPLLMFPYLRKHRRPRALALTLALIGAILGLNLLMATRNVGVQRPSFGAALVDTVTHVPGQLKHFVTGVDLAEFSVLELEHEAYSTRTNPLTFHPLQTLLCAVGYWVPRKILHNKPPAAGQWVVDRLFPETKQIRASFNPALFGDFWADGGWWTIVIYDILVGIICRFIWEYFKRHSFSEGVQILFAATLPVLVIMVRNSVVDAFARSLFLSGPLLLCLIVCSRERIRRFAGYRIRPALKQAIPS
jgi:hypothetical protein